MASAVIPGDARDRTASYRRRNSFIKCYNVAAEFIPSRQLFRLAVVQRDFWWNNTVVYYKLRNQISEFNHCRCAVQDGCSVLAIE